MKHFGFDSSETRRKGSGSGTSASDTLIDEKGMEENILNVTVLGNEYIYDNSKIELTDFIAEVKSLMERSSFTSTTIMHIRIRCRLLSTSLKRYRVYRSFCNSR